MSNIKIVNDAYGRPHPVKEEQLFEYGIKPDGTPLGTTQASSTVKTLIVNLDVSTLVPMLSGASPYVVVYEPSANEYVIDYYVAEYEFVDLYNYIFVTDAGNFPDGFNNYNDWTGARVYSNSGDIADTIYGAVNAYNKAGIYARNVSKQPIVAAVSPMSNVNYRLVDWQPDTIIGGYSCVVTEYGTYRTDGNQGASGSTEPDWSINDAITDNELTWIPSGPGWPTSGSAKIIILVSTPEQVYP